MKAVIFDFNGTLLLDTKLHVDIWIKIIREKTGYDMKEEEFLEKAWGKDNVATIREFLEITDNNMIQQISEEKEQMYRKQCVEAKIKLIQGAERLFDYLRDRKIAFTIATGSTKGNVDFYFQQYHLDTWFDYQKVVYDDGTLPGKPDPAIYRKACERIHRSPLECMVVEDSVYGVMAARNAGISEIYVRSNNKSFPLEVTGIVKDFDELLFQWRKGGA